MASASFQSKSRDQSTSDSRAASVSLPGAGYCDPGNKQAAFARIGVPPLRLSGDER